MKINRFRGFRFRRYAFAMNIVGGVWLLVSSIMFLENPQWLTLAAALCLSLLSLPAFLIAAACTEIAEREFEAAKGN